MGGEVDEPQPEAQSAEVALDPDASGEWDEVRESWIDEDLSKLQPAGRRSREPPPPRRGRSSVPPPLPPPHIIAAMLERLAAGDWEGTLLAARTALAIHPTNDDALQCREMAGSELRKLYRARLGLADDQDAIPHRTASPGALTRQARTVLDLVDGERSVAALLEKSPLSELDTLRHLAELYLGGDLMLRR